MSAPHTQVEIPKRLRTRPLFKGFPIPFLVLVKDEVPDFRVTDDERWMKVVRDKICQLCGHPLGVNIFFIGGPSSHENHLFYDPAVHRDCGQYAMKVCPYLANSEWKYSDRELPPGGYKVKEVNEVTRERPAKLGIFRTHSYDIVRPVVKGVQSNQLFIRAGAFDQEEWF